MSYIRASTKVPGQKNGSRTYAYWTIGGGIVIMGRPDGIYQTSQTMVSIPEFHYMATNFLNSFNNWDKKKGESTANALKRMHKGFFAKYDAEFEKQHRETMKKFMARARRSQLRQKKQMARLMKKWKQARPSAINKLIEERALDRLADKRALAILKSRLK